MTCDHRTPDSTFPHYPTFIWKYSLQIRVQTRGTPNIVEHLSFAFEASSYSIRALTSPDYLLTSNHNSERDTFTTPSPLRLTHMPPLRLHGFEEEQRERPRLQDRAGTGNLRAGSIQPSNDSGCASASSARACHPDICHLKLRSHRHTFGCVPSVACVEDTTCHGSKEIGPEQGRQTRGRRILIQGRS
jgi:hypothetical protein